MSCVKDFVFSGTTGTLYLVHVYVYRVYSFDAAYRARARLRRDDARTFTAGFRRVPVGGTGRRPKCPWRTREWFCRC